MNRNGKKPDSGDAADYLINDTLTVTGDSGLVHLQPGIKETINNP